MTDEGETKMEERLEKDRRRAEARLATRMDEKAASRIALNVYMELISKEPMKIYPMLKDGYKLDRRLYVALQKLLLNPRYASAIELAGGPPAFISRNRCGVPFKTPRGTILIYAFFMAMPERFPRDE